MLWKLLQFTVFAAVLFANVHWQWTPNGFVAGTLAAFCAFAVTALLSEFFRLMSWSRLKLRTLRGHQGPQHRNLPRRQVF